MKSPAVATLTLLSLAACGGGGMQQDDMKPQIALSPAAKIESGRGGPTPPAPAPTPAPPTPPTTPAPAPGGGARLPPDSTIDGPAWYFDNISSLTTVGFSPNIDFGRIENTGAGGIPVGSSRAATELVYNVSKKTALTVTSIRITGADPGDFVISPQAIASAATTVLPANKSAVEALQISFKPTAQGTRTANVVFTSAAGVVQISLTGVGLPTRPILGGVSPLTFFPDSAPATFVLQNTGGATLALNAIRIGGANPAAFELSAANSGQSNCFPGVLIAPLAFCFLAVGEVPGATPPASGSLVLLSNDPVNPEIDVPLTLVPLP